MWVRGGTDVVEYTVDGNVKETFRWGPTQPSPCWVMGNIGVYMLTWEINAGKRRLRLWNIADHHLIILPKDNRTIPDEAVGAMDGLSWYLDRPDGYVTTVTVSETVEGEELPSVQAFMSNA